MFVVAIGLEAKTGLYVLRSGRYQVSEYQHLTVLEEYDLDRKLVLSDPHTSYYLRRFTGAYAVTVPPGHASPAVDYRTRDALWELCLQDPIAAACAADADYILYDLNKLETPKVPEEANIVFQNDVLLLITADVDCSKLDPKRSPERL